MREEEGPLLAIGPCPRPRGSATAPTRATAGRTEVDETTNISIVTKNFPTGRQTVRGCLIAGVTA